jgi:ribonuclease PH
MRKIEIQTGYTKYAEGSVLISFGNTKVLCNATVEERVPPFVKERGENYGWVTAEYNMLPRATHQRTSRERSKVGGRTQEIQRLIGRSLRSVVDLSKLGQRKITLDCDVIQADGGTRTAAISGAYISLMLALKGLKEKGLIKEIPVTNHLAAVSVGKSKGEYLLDLDYDEDSKAEIDMNVIMTDSGKFIEVQGTGEEHPFSEDELQKLISYAKIGIENIVEKQKEIIA